MNRIETVAKLSYQYAFLIDDKDIDEWWAKEGSKDRWYELALQLFPQSPGDKELREKIAEMSCERCESRAASEKACLAGYKLGECPGYYDDADQILVLLQPKIEEARRELIIEVDKFIKQHTYGGIVRAHHFRVEEWQVQLEKLGVALSGKGGE